jgi:hypothetical protein
MGKSAARRQSRQRSCERKPRARIRARNAIDLAVMA